MSDAKPFAEAMSDGDEWYVVIDGIKLGSSCANAICHRAARINSAVARERREAAAEALREAVELFPSGRSAKNGELWTSEQIHAALRAAALRKGDG